MSFPYHVDPAVPATAVWENEDGGRLIAALFPQIYDRVLTRLSVSGPPGSRVDVYARSISVQNRLDSTSRGETNTADYTNPIPFGRGTSLFVVWRRAAGVLSSESGFCTFYVAQDRR